MNNYRIDFGSREERQEYIANQAKEELKQELKAEIKKEVRKEREEN